MRLSLTLLVVLATTLAACAGALGFRRSSPEHPFEHRAHVEHGVSCVACHVGVASSGAEDALHLPANARCLSCHQEPHDARDCALCHGEAHVREETALLRRHLRFEHSVHAAVVHGDCVRCHTGVGDPRPTSLRASMATCFTCHAHSDQWRMRDCDACHRDLPAEHVLPETHVVHDGDWIREHGVRAASARDLCAACHSERMCAGCHGVGTVPALPARMFFDAVKLEGLHRAGFRSRHAEEARAAPGLCQTCHSEETCIACHTTSGVAPGTGVRSPHPAGWLAARRGGGEHGVQARIDPMSCAGCHGGAGERLCVGCHRVGGGGGNPHGPGFTSTKNKTHDVPCRLCHGAAP